MNDPYAWKPITEMGATCPGVYWVWLRKDKRLVRAAWVSDGLAAAAWCWLVRAPYTGEYAPFYSAELFDRVRLVACLDDSFDVRDVAGNMTHNRAMLAPPGRRDGFVRRLQYVPPEERAQYREING